MRSLVISVVALMVIIIPWAIFINDAGRDLESMIDTVKNTAIKEALAENWQEAEKALSYVSNKWYDGRKGFSIFLDAQSIDDIECSLARAQAYVHAQEKGSALGEMAYLHHQLIFLLENETTKLENIL